MTPRPGSATTLCLALLLTTSCAARGTGTPAIEAPDSIDARRQPTTEVRVATANLWGVSVAGVDIADEIDARFAAFAESLAENPHGLDVVLIQEAWDDDARRALVENEGVVRRFPWRVDAVQHPGGSGLVILSAFPVEAVRFHRYEAQGSCLKFWEGDCSGGKGVLAARLRIGSESFWFADTHLIACYQEEPALSACDQDDPNGEARWGQVEELRTFLQSLDPEAPLVIGGDFNFVPSSRYHTTFAKDPAGRPWIDPGDEAADPGRLDYIWTRPGARQRWVATHPLGEFATEPVPIDGEDAIPVSDHPLLMTTLRLTEGSAR